MVLPILISLAGQFRHPGPIDIAYHTVEAAVGSRKNDVQISVVKSGKKEEYQIIPKNGKIEIVGSDENGAMYGAFEFVERLKNDGDKAWTEKATGKPYLADRGLNLFLTLPWDYEKNDTDYDPAALTDPNRWWFHNEDYWTTLLDLMAHSRLNWLDIHGGWDISVTNAPNLYAYFVTAPSFPLVGVTQDIKAKDIRQLNHVIEMAHERGIRVSLMAYEANLKIPQNPNPPYEATEPNVYKYTREVVEAMIREAPGLDAIGYRIGESGKGESFFNCYQEAVKNSGRDIPIVTRSWITRKQKVLPLARASKDFTVEIKYNGEQWGAPYMVAGGRVANWYSYSFEDYLSDSSQKSEVRSQKMWPGNDAEGGGKWPSEPYKIVWQVRANGTHRIFPFYNPDWVRRTIKCMKMGTASGYTIEGEDAYYPKQPEYYLADATGNPFKWIHQRDAMYWTTWGRLGYDPTVPTGTFDKECERHLGAGTAPLVQKWKDASILLSKAFMAYSLGPDHRSHAPELEWGGDTPTYIQGQGFDSDSFLPINEEFANYWTRGVDGRISLWNASHLLSGQTADEFLSSSNPRARAMANEINLMVGRGLYSRSRFMAAAQYAQAEAQSGTASRIPDGMNDMPSRTHEFLAESPLFRPFTEKLRMHTNTFRWADEQTKVEAEAKRIAALPAPSSNGPSYSSGASKAFPGSFSWRAEGDKIIGQLLVSDDAKAWLLYKPLPSSTYFHKMPMNHVKLGVFEAELPRTNCGYMLAAEAYHPNYESARRFPDPMKETPYLVVPARPGPTPQIYSAEEAMTFLDPKAITPEKYSTMLLGTRAWGFFSGFNNSTKRKILDPVEKGMRLVILQQDFSKYKLDWLPKPLKIEAANETTFDPAGQLGLEKVTTDGMMWQKFGPSEGWEIFGNGGLARLKLGKGEVWVTSARLMQRMHIPGVARDFVRLLSLGGKAKPTILIDSCSEGADFSSSCHADLMNSHDIPFMTLGEVIAKEQGMSSFTPVSGPVKNDDLLEGRGVATANAATKAMVQKASKRTQVLGPQSFIAEQTRRRRELYRALGLDPQPLKTDLNARITGVIHGNGYRIEKLVYESRPKFYVTAHVYVPELTPERAQGKYPIIVNVNGHWAHKKDEDRIQLRCQFQALQGYIAIAIDSPGWSFEGNSLIERRPEGDHNDFKLVEGGSNTTGYYVWDAIRGLDYMATRPDTDMQHIGLTGASGGGLATLYTFAADDRYTAAVPVVYMSSMELAPDNGCLCNHVPGTCQVGDRSDVMAIQAPKPVFIFGAQNDGEFPPAAMRLTREKMAKEWGLLSRADDVKVRIFDGPHDYNQLMREQMIGFFNKYLKGEGDGSPVPQPQLTAINPEDHVLLALDPPASGERTMRDISKEYLAKAYSNVSVEEAIATNGGRPNISTYATPKASGPMILNVDGVNVPGILVMPTGKVKGVRIVVSDHGKAVEVDHTKAEPGWATLYLDTFGVGELAGVELRYPVYLGKSAAFIGGGEILAAREALAKISKNVELVGRGPVASQTVMWAGLFDNTCAKVTGLEGLHEWLDVFRDDVPDAAIQPRAHLMGSLANLQSKVKNSTWK